MAEKDLLTPQGTLKSGSFPPGQIEANPGPGYSATAVQAEIRKMIESESLEKPLSDSAIAKTPNAKGVRATRRTVVKY